MSTPIAETYDEIKNLVYHTTFKFWEKYGGDFEEMVCEGNMAFMNVYNKYDASRGKFTTILVHAIRNTLIDYMRRKTQHDNRYGMSLSQPSGEEGTTSRADSLADVKHNWGPAKFVEFLTEDAQTVVEMVLESPRELNEFYFHHFCSAPKGGIWYAALRCYLKSIGWTSDRIGSCFNEIREALA